VLVLLAELIVASPNKLMLLAKETEELVSKPVPDANESSPEPKAVLFCTATRPCETLIFP